MKATHTPGPWHWVDPATDAPIDISAADERITAEFQPSYIGPCSLRTVRMHKNREDDRWELPVFLAETYELSKADARLIAAAPDLLQELQNIANAKPSTWDEEMRDQFQAWAQSRARAAIAKATA